MPFCCQLTLICIVVYSPLPVFICPCAVPLSAYSVCIIVYSPLPVFICPYAVPLSAHSICIIVYSPLPVFIYPLSSSVISPLGMYSCIRSISGIQLSSVANIRRRRIHIHVHVKRKKNNNRTCRRYYSMTKCFIFVLYIPNDCLIYDIKCGAAMSLIRTLL